MDAQPVLAVLARALEEARLEAILIGNMAAALHGAPVSTVDVDFFFRKTRGNLKKLKEVAGTLRASILRPYYPASGLFRLQRDEDALQVDFMSAIDGVGSFERVRSRAKRLAMGGHELLVADLEDIIASKKAAGRSKDKAVLDILRVTLDETKRAQQSRTRGTPEGK
ncbi:MAG: nucleotidyltransferase [Bryobacteraceae bacterium]|nr:nucleotidyltransferase [Bryobacteraceae bacterium]